MSSFQIKLNWFVPNNNKDAEEEKKEDETKKAATPKKKKLPPLEKIDNQSRSHCTKQERTLTIDDRTMTLHQFMERVRQEVLAEEDQPTIRLTLYKPDVYPSLKFVPIEIDEDPAKLLVEEISARSTVLVGLGADDANDDGPSESDPAGIPLADESDEEEAKKRKRSDDEDDVVEIDQKPPAKKVAAAESDDDEDDDIVEIVDDDDEWSCPRCTLLNPNAVTVCSACQGTRDGTVDVAPQHAHDHAAHAPVANDGVRAPDPVRREQLIGGPPERGMGMGMHPFAAGRGHNFPPPGVAAAAHYADAASAEHLRRSRRRRQEEEAAPEQRQQQPQQNHGLTAEDAVLID